MDGTAHVGVEVHRVDEIHSGVFLREMLDGAAHGDEAVAEVLAAVPGDEDEPPPAVEARHVVACAGERRFELAVEARVGFYLVDHPVEGVDDGVAGDGDFRFVDVLAQQVFAAERGGGEVVGGYAPGDLAVHLLWPRAVDVVGAQPCLYVSYRNLLVESGEGGGCAGGGVAVDEHYVGPRLTEHVAHAEQHARGHVVEILPLLHYVEVVVGTDVEYLKHLVEHLPVLAGDAYRGAELSGMLLEFLYERSHLDGLGAGPENKHDTLGRVVEG